MQAQARCSPALSSA